MLASEATRLLAIEALCPTECLLTDSGFPTLAGKVVLDSEAIALRHIDPKTNYTPGLALYTPESGVALRGPLTDADDTVADAVLDIIGELGVVAREGDEEFAEAMMASSDSDARLVLAALMAQARFQLERSARGLLWRRLVRRIIKIELVTLALPELGARWHRITMRMHCEIRDDDFNMVEGGLPEPIRSVCAALPDGSYAKAKLLTLAAYFAAEPPTALAGMDFTARIPGGTEINGVVGTPKP